MKNFPKEAHSVYEWPYQSPFKEKNHLTKHTNKKSRPRKNNLEETNMIRSLQAIFCKGRYNSWILSQDKN